VRQVEPLFGPMPDFETTLVRKIGQRAAYCVRADDLPDVLGGMLLGGAAPAGWIRWLAVRASARGGGLGQVLVAEAVRRFRGFSTVSLDTFREDNDAGRPARRLYERMGFEPGPLIEADGQLRQRYVLRLAGG
jgi:ribosomal protein S18 acetylase RimI-like enzyme